MLNEISSSPEGYIFYLKPYSNDTVVIDVSIDGVKPGKYLVRIQVEGAESPLVVDIDKNSPTYNQYIGPSVILQEVAAS